MILGGSGGHGANYDEEERTVKSVKRRVMLILVYLLMNCAYIMFGGTVMYYLEHNNEVEDLKKKQDLVATFNLSLDQTDSLEDLGICVFPNHLYPHWSYTGSCFYAFTVITTIGYGSFAPYTKNGQSFTAAFAIPGIAIIAVVLTNVASLLAETIEAVMARSRKNQEVFAPIPFFSDLDPEGKGHIPADMFPEVIKSMIQTQPDALLMKTLMDLLSKHGRGDVDTGQGDTLSYDMVMRGVALWFQLSSEVPPPHKTTLKYLFITWLGVMVWIMIWAGIFSGIEGWTVLEGMWFSFVSLSTIGFGDYVPNTTIGRICGFIFMAPGLGLMGAFFAVLSNMFTRARFTMSSKMDLSKKMFEAQGFTSLVQSDAFLQARPSVMWKEDLSIVHPLKTGDGSPDSTVNYGNSLVPVQSSGSLVSASGSRALSRKKPPIPSLIHEHSGTYSPPPDWGTSPITSHEKVFPDRSLTDPLMQSSREQGEERGMQRKASQHAISKNSAACPNGHTLWVFAKLAPGDKASCGRCGNTFFGDGSVTRKCGKCHFKLCPECTGGSAGSRRGSVTDYQMDGSLGRSNHFNRDAGYRSPVRKKSSEYNLLQDRYDGRRSPTRKKSGEALAVGERGAGNSSGGSAGGGPPGFPPPFKKYEPNSSGGMQLERFNSSASLGKSRRAIGREQSPSTAALEPETEGVMREMADIVAGLESISPRRRKSQINGFPDTYRGGSV